MIGPFTPMSQLIILFTKQKQSPSGALGYWLEKYAADYSEQMTNLKHLLSTLHYDYAVRIKSAR